MNKTYEAQIRNAVEGLLPEGSAFMLVFAQAGKEEEPAFISNCDPDSAFQAMRELVEARDRQKGIALN